MNCSLGISNFLEAISSLLHSVVFLYFFALIAEEGFLISSCYSLELCIKKRWQEYTEEPHKKDLPDQDNHDGVITHLESDILECEVKWALESITTTKLVEVMEFQLSYFKSWKMTLWKCCTQYASKFGKFSSGHRTGKDQFSFQSQRKAMPKNVQTTAQLHSSHTLVK